MSAADFWGAHAPRVSSSAPRRRLSGFSTSLIAASSRRAFAGERRRYSVSHSGLLFDCDIPQTKALDRHGVTRFIHKLAPVVPARTPHLGEDVLAIANFYERLFRRGAETSTRGRVRPQSLLRAMYFTIRGPGESRQ